MSDRENARAFLEQRMSESTFRHLLAESFRQAGHMMAAESVPSYTKADLHGIAHRLLAEG